MKLKLIVTICLLSSSLAPNQSIQAQANRAKNGFDLKRNMESTTQFTTASVSSAEAENPLLSEWKGAFGGTPLFNLVKVTDFKPALESAMAEKLSEVERIAKNPVIPTFENTIAAMERTGRRLDRVQAVYGVWSSAMNDQEFQKVESEMSPKLAAFSDKITQNEALFRRIEAVYNSSAKTKLTPEQQRLTWLYYTTFVRAGARLKPDAKRVCRRLISSSPGFSLASVKISLPMKASNFSR